MFIKDGDKWSPAYPVADSKTVPVQVVVESKSADGKFNTEISTITQFRPTLFLDEEAYTVCPRFNAFKTLFLII